MNGLVDAIISLRPSLPRRIARQRRGFTLVELMVSMAVMTLLVATAGSSITLLLRSAENNRNLMASGSGGAASGSAQAAAARNAVDLLTGDVKVATGILNTPLSNGGFQLILTVPGRYGSNPFETLIYQWNGPTDGSLTRQLNANPPALIAQNVQVLNLALASKTIGAPLTSGGDPILISHDGTSGLNLHLLSLNDKSQLSQYVQPTLSPTATSWGITHVQMQLLQPQGGGIGTMNVLVYPADALQHPVISPSQSPLGSATVDISTLPTSGTVWTDVPIVNLGGLTPGAGVCVVLSTTTGSAATAMFDASASGSGIVYSTSTDGGATWTSAPAQALQFRLYGPVAGSQ